MHFELWTGPDPAETGPTETLFMLINSYMNSVVVHAN